MGAPNAPLLRVAAEQAAWQAGSGRPTACARSLAGGRHEVAKVEAAAGLVGCEVVHPLKGRSSRLTRLSCV